jgi:excisionase family DNA binding protein
MPAKNPGSNQISPDIADLISLQKAAKLTGLTPGHIRLLVRNGEIWGMKFGRNWVTTEEAVKDYQARANPRGRPKKSKATSKP